MDDKAVETSVIASAAGAASGASAVVTQEIEKDPLPHELESDLAQAKGAVGKLHTFMQNLSGVESLVKADLVAVLNEAGKYLSKLV
jgi:hypothetical protein